MSGRFGDGFKGNVRNKANFRFFRFDCWGYGVAPGGDWGLRERGFRFGIWE